jgi:hypothetical protein
MCWFIVWSKRIDEDIVKQESFHSTCQQGTESHNGHRNFLESNLAKYLNIIFFAKTEVYGIIQAVTSFHLQGKKTYEIF